MKYIVILISLFAVSTTFAEVKRPPQFVLMAFDGSYSLNMWQETLDLAKEQPFRFTYFISGTYFLLDQNKTVYSEPTHGPGKSAIGWGGNSIPNLIRRVDFVNQAFDEGHEIASHGNGHFDGTEWTLPQWSSELSQFKHLIFDIYKINSVPSSVADNPFHFDAEKILGFRAPLLGRNDSMYQTLNDFAYAYDTSQTAPTNYWPRVKNGLWNFPLADLRIAGSGKRTLSMDYNFYFTQSKGLPDPKNYQLYKTEMLNTYLNYFKSNYYGNRAPVNIGHHFSKWNAGAYWDALKQFSAEICGLPEVQCVTYKELLSFVKDSDEATLTAYQNGEFPKLSTVGMSANLKAIPQALEVDLSLPDIAAGDILRVETSDRNKVLHSIRKTYAWSLNGQEVAEGSRPTLSLAKIHRSLRKDDVISVALKVGNKEIQRTTRKVHTASASTLRFGADDLEHASLRGDMPAAHLNEPL